MSTKESALSLLEDTIGCTRSRAGALLDALTAHIRHSSAPSDGGGGRGGEKGCGVCGGFGKLCTGDDGGGRPHRIGERGAICETGTRIRCPACSTAAPTPTEEGRRWWIVLYPSDGTVLGTFRSAKQADVWRDSREIVEVVPASRAESASRERDAALARAEAAERQVAANYELLKDWDNYGSGDLSVCAREVRRVLTADHPQAFEKLQERVRELEAEVDRLERVPVSAEIRAMASDLGAADMRERAAKVVAAAIPAASRERAGGEASPWSTLHAVCYGINALPLSPAPSTPTSADDEAGGKERT